MEERGCVRIRGGRAVQWVRKRQGALRSVTPTRLCKGLPIMAAWCPDHPIRWNHCHPCHHMRNLPSSSASTHPSAAHLLRRREQVMQAVWRALWVEERGQMQFTSRSSHDYRLQRSPRRAAMQLIRLRTRRGTGGHGAGLGGAWPVFSPRRLVMLSAVARAGSSAPRPVSRSTYSWRCVRVARMARTAHRA